MKPLSFFSSSLWKRRFSSRSTSPCFSARTASSATGPTQSSAKATGLPSASASGSTSGLSDISGTRLPSGRPKWLSTTTLAPLAASSFSVGAARSMRVASVTLPAFIGTLRSTRTSTRLPATSRSSSVLKVIWGIILLLVRTFADDEYQHLALTTTRNQFVTGLLAISGEVLLRRGIGGAHGEQAARRQFAQLAVGAQHRQGAEQPGRVVFEGVSHVSITGDDSSAWLPAASGGCRRAAWCRRDGC